MKGKVHAVDFHTISTEFGRSGEIHYPSVTLTRICLVTVFAITSFLFLRLASFAWILHMVSWIWFPEFGFLKLVSSVWFPEFGFLTLVSWVWFPEYGFLSLVSWDWFPEFGFLSLVSWVWFPGLGFLSLVSWVWFPEFGFLNLVSSVWFPQLGFLSLVSWVGGTGLLRLGEPLGGSWGNPQERVACTASLRHWVRTL